MKGEEVKTFKDLIKSKDEPEKIEELINQPELTDSKGDVLTFIDFLAETKPKAKQLVKTIVEVTKKEIKANIPDIKISEVEKLPEPEIKKIVENTTIQARVNLLDPVYLKSVHEQYLIKVQSPEYKKRLALSETLPSGGIKRVVNNIIVQSCLIGDAIIGQCKIG